MPRSEGTLVVRLHSLGDVVLASAAASRASVFVTRPEYLPVADRFPGGVEAIPLQGGWRELRSIASGFSRVCDLQNNLTTRLGLMGRNVTRFTMDRKLRKRVLAGGGLRMPWRAAEYMAACGFRGDPSPVMIRRSFPEKGTTTIGIVAGGRWPMKSIPEGVVTELARLFCDVMDARVVILGGASDRDTAKRIVHEAGYRNVSSAAGAGDVNDLIASVEELDLLVSPDSGPAHLAAALGVPVLVVFTSTSPALGFYPPDMEGSFMADRVPCRPCHRHGGRRCPAGDSICRDRLVPAELFRRARCLMR